MLAADIEASLDRAVPLLVWWSAPIITHTLVVTGVRDAIAAVIPLAAVRLTLAKVIAVVAANVLLFSAAEATAVFVFATSPFAGAQGPFRAAETPAHADFALRATIEVLI